MCVRGAGVKASLAPLLDRAPKSAIPPRLPVPPASAVATLALGASLPARTAGQVGARPYLRRPCLLTTVLDVRAIVAQRCRAPSTTPLRLVAGLLRATGPAGAAFLDQAAPVRVTAAFRATKVSKLHFHYISLRAKQRITHVLFGIASRAKPGLGQISLKKRPFLHSITYLP